MYFLSQRKYKHLTHYVEKLGMARLKMNISLGPLSVFTNAVESNDAILPNITQHNIFMLSTINNPQLILGQI